VSWYNGLETWRAGAGKWASAADPDRTLFPIVLDFIRDRLHDYRNRARPVGRPIEQAAAAVDRRILDAIAERYAWLAEECEQQKAKALDLPGAGGRVDGHAGQRPAQNI